MKGIITIFLLILSNTFMTFAWYGHLKFNQMKGFDKLALPLVILISWGIALFEYCFQVPANRGPALLCHYFETYPKQRSPA